MRVVGFYPMYSGAAIDVRAFFTDGGGPLMGNPAMVCLTASIEQWLTLTYQVATPTVSDVRAAMLDRAA